MSWRARHGLRCSVTLRGVALLADILADDTRRRDYLLGQAMFQSRALEASID